MIRASQLPIAYRCGLAPALNAANPEVAGRRAAQGTAWHALVAGDPAAKELLAALTAEERAEVHGFKAPTDIPGDAVVEIPVGLTPSGRFAPYGSEGLLTQGTADVAWKDGETAVVADYKTGQMPVEDGPWTLQIMAYAFALADMWGSSAIKCGLWYARAGRWEWTPVIPLDSEEAGETWRKISIAAAKPALAEQGPHCESCYERGRCPSRLLPALAGPRAAELDPFVNGAAELTSERASAGLRVIAAMREVADRAEEHVRAAITAGLRVEESGKVYGPSEVAGRRTADMAALERDGMNQYIRPGKPYLRWGWRKAESR